MIIGRWKHKITANLNTALNHVLTIDSIGYGLCRSKYDFERVRDKNSK